MEDQSVERKDLWKNKATVAFARHPYPGAAPLRGRTSVFPSRSSSMYGKAAHLGHSS